MNRVLVAIGVLIALLLAGVFYELHGINRRLDAARSVVADVARELADSAAIEETATERERRLAARARSVQRAIEDTNDVLKRLAAADRVQPTTPRARPDAGRRPSADTSPSR